VFQCLKFRFRPFTFGGSFGVAPADSEDDTAHPQTSSYCNVVFEFAQLECWRIHTLHCVTHFVGDYSNALTHHCSTKVSVSDSTNDRGKFQSFMPRTFVFS
jgi:hypothetical protein